MAKVTMYTTSTCPFCVMQKTFFKDKKIEYQEILVDENPDEAMKMIEISGQMGVPFTVIDQDNGERVTILGFDQARLSEALDLS
ncbi:MAG: glutaredoxin family protein [Candidatus Curtissbacteria bacterium]|nr:glutaredoxin family protein [Candidatus Curtissbacteria bacterium]